MRGHIKKRGKNSYSIALSMGRDPNTGKYKQQWVTVKGTKKDAEKRLAELLHEIDTGTFIKPKKTTLAEFLELWLKDYVWLNLSPRTAEGYESIIYRHLIPAMGNILLMQLKAERIQRYYSEKLASGRFNGKGGLSSTTVNHHHTCLHRALKMAVRLGMLSRNPADAVTSPPIQSFEINTMDENEVHVFLEASKQTPYYALFYLELYTALRRSELLALRWCDIDLLLFGISVNRSLHHLLDGSIVIRPTKTLKGRRYVDLPASASLVLREHKVKRTLECRILGIPMTDESFVFCHTDGKPLLPDTVSHAWVKIVKHAGLKHFRLHDGRHTHASLLLKQGTHPKVVQERLGHATISTTLDLYSHVSPGLQEAAARRFDEALSPKYNKMVDKIKEIETNSSPLANY